MWTQWPVASKLNPRNLTGMRLLRCVLRVIGNETRFIKWSMRNKNYQIKSNIDWAVWTHLPFKHPFFTLFSYILFSSNKCTDHAFIYQCMELLIIPLDCKLPVNAAGYCTAWLSNAKLLDSLKQLGIAIIRFINTISHMYHLIKIFGVGLSMRSA